MADAAEASRSYGAVLRGDGLSRPDKLLHPIYLIYIQRTEIDDAHSFALLLFFCQYSISVLQSPLQAAFIGIFSKIAELQLTYLSKSSIILICFYKKGRGLF